MYKSQLFRALAKGVCIYYSYRETEKKGLDCYMCVVSINVPEEILLDLHENEDDFGAYMKCILAVGLYRNKKVSLGYCASVADMTKEDFIKYLGKNEISIFSFESEKEFLEELANA